MKFIPFFFTFCTLIFLGCQTSNLQTKEDEIANKIKKERDFQINQAAGAVIATKKILDGSSKKDIYITSAQKTIKLANQSLPNLPIEEIEKWEKIGDDLILNNDAGLIDNSKHDVIQSKARQRELEIEYKQARTKLLLLQDKEIRDNENKIAEILSNKKIISDLAKYFAWAAVICIISSAVLSYFLGFKVGINGIIAGGFFFLASYLVTQSFFGWIAGGLAIFMFFGTIYYIWGKAQPESVNKKIVKTIDKMSESEDPEKRKSAEIFKVEMKSSLAGSKEEKSHKQYIKKMKTT